jgi:small GTP-binding protein
MTPHRYLRPRLVVLLLFWTLPVLAYFVIGSIAMYQTGWLNIIVWTLPAMWLAAWLVGKFWPPAKPRHHSVDGRPIKAPEFWTPRDAAAIAIVEEFRGSVDIIDYRSIADVDRYVRDARGLAEQLAKHYHADDNENLLNPLTLVEILSVIHLAVEDLEEWMLKNVPGSDLATVGQLGQIPHVVNAVNLAQKLIYVASAVLNPAKLLAYPLWRKSGRVTVELQNEVIRGFYQRYLRQLGYYLIEMYSGRLRGGSRHYRSQFGQMTSAVHASGGGADALDQLQDVSTTIAVMGQVKAGKSSLINSLMNEQVAVTGILPETREVQQYQYSLPGSSNAVTLLDTPGYSEADVTRQQLREIKTASEQADIVLLVMAANVSARDADVQIVRELAEHYRGKTQLRPPAIIVVLTHIDLLRPIRQWSPPYDWRQPTQPKEESIAEAVSYVKELLGDSVAGYACVYVGDTHAADSSVVDEVVPQLIEHLDHGHAAALLKAFYRQLSRERFAKLSRQVIGLLKSLT